MFDRFNEEARRSLFFARAKCGERDGDEITAEDLLEGILLAAPESVLRFATTERNALLREESLQSAEAVEAWMQRLFTDDGDSRLSKEIPIGIQAKRVLESAFTEADSLGHNEIGTTHLLLGLLCDEDTTASRTLSGCGVTLSAIREALRGGT